VDASKAEGRYAPLVLYLSFDQDWAPEWATRALTEALAEAGLEGTLFVTHDCPSLATLRASGHIELGWHPNFLPGSSHGDTVEQVLDTMAGWVPEAVGARAHTLMRGTPLLMAYRERGLRYDAADIFDGRAGLTPFESWTGVLRLPIWFEDDVHLERGLGCDVSQLALEAPGLKICTFHPVLVALNASDLSSYRDLKGDLAQRGIGLTEATRGDFARHHQDLKPGVGDLFNALITWLTAHPASQGGPLKSLCR
jgi:hypothetical protein